MARRSFSAATYTPTATADTATTLANGTYQAIGASGATARIKIKEIWIGGQATASAVCIMQFARDHVLGASLTALAAPNSDGPLDTSTAVLSAVPLTFVAATTPPQRSTLTTAARLSLTLNAFGGIVAWHPDPGEEWGITGITVDVSESSLSAYTGGNVGLIGSHIIYEEL